MQRIISLLLFLFVLYFVSSHQEDSNRPKIIWNVLRDSLLTNEWVILLVESEECEYTNVQIKQIEEFTKNKSNTQLIIVNKKEATQLGKLVFRYRWSPGTIMLLSSPFFNAENLSVSEIHYWLNKTSKSLCRVAYVGEDFKEYFNYCNRYTNLIQDNYFNEIEDEKSLKSFLIQSSNHFIEYNNQNSDIQSQNTIKEYLIKISNEFDESEFNYAKISNKQLFLSLLQNEFGDPNEFLKENKNKMILFLHSWEFGNVTIVNDFPFIDDSNMYKITKSMISKQTLTSLSSSLLKDNIGNSNPLLILIVDKSQISSTQYNYFLRSFRNAHSILKKNHKFLNLKSFYLDSDVSKDIYNHLVDSNDEKLVHILMISEDGRKYILPSVAFDTNGIVSFVNSNWKDSAVYPVISDKISTTIHTSNYDYWYANKNKKMNVIPFDFDKINSQPDKNHIVLLFYPRKYIF